MLDVFFLVCISSVHNTNIDCIQCASIYSIPYGDVDEKKACPL